MSDNQNPLTNEPLPMNRTVSQAETLAHSISQMLISSGATQAGPPSHNESLKMLKDIAEDFKQYSDKQSEALVGVKTALATKKKAALENSVREEARKVMTDYVREQVRVELNKSLQAIMPKGPSQQHEETRDLIEQVKLSKANSDARARNASLNPGEAWAVVKKADGTDSRAWPADRQSLWAYDADQLKVLLKDFRLQEHGSPKDSMNRFMIYIGVPVSHLLV